MWFYGVLEGGGDIYMCWKKREASHEPFEGGSECTACRSNVNVLGV